MRSFSPAKKRIEVSSGESVRILRELQGLTQIQLARLSEISPAAIAAIELGRLSLTPELVAVFAAALHCHPDVFGSPPLPLT